jgi:hypothetical protein
VLPGLRVRLEFPAERLTATKYIPFWGFEYWVFVQTYGNATAKAKTNAGVLRFRMTDVWGEMTVFLGVSEENRQQQREKQLGGYFTSHPSQKTRRVGHPIDRGKREEKQIPPLRCGMTNKREFRGKGASE